MNVTFRPCSKKDLAQLAAVGVSLQSYLAVSDFTERRGSVVTVNGCVVLVTDRLGQVVYQSDVVNVPEVLRAQRRVWRALSGLGYEEFERLKRRDRERASIADILSGEAEKVGGAYVRRRS